jgi:hypothetical protein
MFRAMADTYQLNIDLARLAGNLSAAEGKPVTNQEVRDFLSTNGFMLQGDGAWTCEEISLRVLGVGEYGGVRVVG